MIHERQRATFGNLKSDQQVERRSRVQARQAPRSSADTDNGSTSHRVIGSSLHHTSIQSRRRTFVDLTPRFSCSVGQRYLNRGHTSSLTSLELTPSIHRHPPTLSLSLSLYLTRWRAHSHPHLQHRHTHHPVDQYTT